MIYARLLEKNIRIRLMGEYLRITIGSSRECKALISALEEAL
jgi:Histidinol-phosphate/aromatic aminotransferase and cobyric acid decarboxylase